MTEQSKEPNSTGGIKMHSCEACDIISAEPVLIEPVPLVDFLKMFKGSVDQVSNTGNSHWWTIQSIAKECGQTPEWVKRRLGHEGLKRVFENMIIAGEPAEIISIDLDWEMDFVRDSISEFLKSNQSTYPWMLERKVVFDWRNNWRGSDMYWIDHMMQNPYWNHIRFTIEVHDWKLAAIPDCLLVDKDRVNADVSTGELIPIHWGRDKKCVDGYFATLCQTYLGRQVKFVEIHNVDIGLSKKFPNERMEECLPDETTPFDELLSRLNDSMPFNRGKTVRNLIYREGATPHIIRMLDDGHWYVRMCTLEVLGHLKPEDARRRIEEIANDDDYAFIRLRAKEALHLIEMRSAQHSISL